MKPNDNPHVPKQTTDISAKDEILESKNRRKEISAIPEMVSIFRLYRFARSREKLYLIIGIIVSAALGVCNPVLSIILGNGMGDFDGRKDNDSALESIKDRCLIMIYVGLIALVLASISTIVWNLTGNLLGIKVRKMYLEAILKKEVEWFDLNKPQELPTKIGSLITKYQAGIGEKVGKVIMASSMSLAGIIIAFIYGWHLALILVAISPITMIGTHLMGLANSLGMAISKRGYAKCGGYAEEALSAIRTVYAFCAESVEKKKYLKELSNAQGATIKNALVLGLAVSLINLSSALSHGLGYFIGSFFVQYNVYNPLKGRGYDSPTVITIFLSALFACMSLGMLAPQIKDIGQARMAAYDIYQVVDSVAEVGKNVPKRIIPPEEFKGRIEFHNVTFYYPTRSDIKILNDFSMVFESGTITGICGETGSGKSTIIQLIERFYKPTSGKITVDGIDINTLDLKWWREMVGYVGQEPVLFNTSIKANIEYGKPGATESEIKTAAKSANADYFIKKLQTGYDTITGSEGSKLSGGQKQRVAIARCLIKAPKILLLDEATSALDNQSEKKVQNSFNRLQKERGMTVLSVAHRLSTIKEADKIIVLHDGSLKEEGTNKELRSRNTIYANLCRLQEGRHGEANENKADQLSERFSRERSGEVSKSLTDQEDFKEEENFRLGKEGEEQKNKIFNEKTSQYKALLWKETFQYKGRFIIAIVLAILCGFYMPVIGFLCGMVSVDLLETDMDELRKKANLDFVGFIVAGVAVFFLSLGMYWAFGYIGAKISYKLRDKLYDHILKMNVGWFDMPENLPSILNNVLSEGTEKINDVIKIVSGTVIQSLSALGIALILSFVFSWRMSLIVLACVPIMGFSTFMESKFSYGSSVDSERLYATSTQILTESVKNFRTVASFSSEERVLKMYSESLEKPLAQAQHTSVIIGLIFGISQLIPYLIYACLFYFTALFQKHYGENPRDALMAVYALLFAASSIGELQNYSPDMGKAYAALFAVYNILEQKPSIESPANPTTNKIRGRIEFKDVYFKYPTRKDYVLQGFNATIEEGKKVAIVGMSGSGKSTVIQLLERFYDVDSGQILIDGVDIKEYSLTDLRTAIGFVSQEPVLFDTTIEENVKYGSIGKTIDDVIEACGIANANEFIYRYYNIDVESFPPLPSDEAREILRTDPAEIRKGYDRKVGPKGSLLSGGEKQRLAIARAVLKEPKIMLFDEATSALDSETEKGVQLALNKVSRGRTSIVVAHRLGTIEEDDTILVLENGRVVESGNKRELENLKGSFYKLYKSVIGGSNNKNS